MNVMVMGIHTGIGKTLCSAILAEALQYDYWKPVQAGDLMQTDSMTVRSLLTNSVSRVHDEAYRLAEAASPHWAAWKEGIEISREGIKLPQSSNSIIVESAGGVMSPLAKGFLNRDLALHLGLPTVLVTTGYLGSINHTLMSVEVLRQANVPVLGIIFCGKGNPSSRSFILEHTGLELWMDVPYVDAPDRKYVYDFSCSIVHDLKQLVHGFAPQG